MYIYLLKKYLLIAIGIATILTVTMSVVGIEHLLAKAFLFAGPVAAYVTFLLFRRKNLWILYHNLRLSVPASLGSCMIIYELAVVGIIVFTAILS